MNKFTLFVLFFFISCRSEEPKRTSPFFISPSTISLISKYNNLRKAGKINNYDISFSKALLKNNCQYLDSIRVVLNDTMSYDGVKVLFNREMQLFDSEFNDFNKNAQLVILGHKFSKDSLNQYVKISFHLVDNKILINNYFLFMDDFNRIVFKNKNSREVANINLNLRWPIADYKHNVVLGSEHPLRIMMKQINEPRIVRFDYFSPFSNNLETYKFVSQVINLLDDETVRNYFNPI